MSDYIKREDAIKAVRDLCFGTDKINAFQVITALNNIRGKYVAKIKRVHEGTWLGNMLYPYFKCSVCGYKIHYINIISGYAKYCPQCGAKMKRGES